MTCMPSVTIVRRIKAPPARVFEAWTTPEALMRWFGPHHTRVESAEVDARPGGGFTVRMVEDNGERHQVSGTYAEFDPDRLLVFTWAWVTMPERESRVMVTFRPVPEGTEVTLIHDRFADATTATNHRRGWTESFERLATAFAVAAAD
ncbi:SRPBCC domain-containing protein [Roseococcus sp. SYP-B2431]|uniref:SRPBCC family protein n=1 Tax=Roseococcus sp. SYP-B2431 TaxID=2496640 RepID=UPI00103C0428|nr:SRPBCC domain-containing protein [Roseococcus sp. SYP-B2431]TCH97566.1 SRPBCC domain-containing protein [Roseococcus sp. SYP-B2431]